MDPEDLIAVIKALLEAVPEMGKDDREQTFENIEAHLKDLKNALEQQD